MVIVHRQNEVIHCHAIPDHLRGTSQIILPRKANGVDFELLRIGHVERFLDNLVAQTSRCSLVNLISRRNTCFFLSSFSGYSGNTEMPPRFNPCPFHPQSALRQLLHGLRDEDRRKRPKRKQGAVKISHEKWWVMELSQPSSDLDLFICLSTNPVRFFVDLQI